MSETRPNEPVQPDDESGWQDVPTYEQPTQVAAQGVTQVIPAQPGGGDLSSFKLNRGLAIGGCAGLVVLVVVIGALVALLSAGGFQTLNANNPIATHEDGVSAILLGEGRLRVRLGSIPRESFLNGNAGRAFQDAPGALPPYLEMKSPLYTLEQRGDGKALVEIIIPNDSQPYHTLDLYRWDKEDGEWVFVPGRVDMSAEIIRTDEFPDNVAVFQTRPATPIIGTMIRTDEALDDVSASALNLVMPEGLEVQSDGALSGALAGGWRLGANYSVVPVVQAREGIPLTGLLNNQASLALHIEDLKAFVVGGSYNGVALDYRSITPADRDAFSAFIADLATALDEYNKVLIVVLHRPGGAPGAWDTGGYDWRAIGAAADAVVIVPGSSPADYAIGGDAMALLDWAIGEISRFKIHLASSSLSVEETGEGIRLISYDEAIAPLGTVMLNTALPEGSDAFSPGTQLTFDLNGGVTTVTPDQNTGAYTYTLDGGQRRIWIVTATTIRTRLDLAAIYNIGGMTINNMLSGGNDAALLMAINEFKTTSVSSVPSQLLMQWTVADASGAVLSENTGLMTPFAWLANAPGEFTVHGQVVGGRVSDRGAVAVRVAEEKPADTPTPRPTAPANPNPGGSPVPTTPPPTTPPPDTHITSGALELGGQTHTLAHPNEMHHAGMAWVKFQHKWAEGHDPAAAVAGLIQLGHSQGFKVLLSIPGPFNPTSINYDAYVNFLAGVAALGPDGIEVWNEMNFDDEWPVGEINGANYVSGMLAPAYQAIKAVNSNILVISGAPTPTGYFGGCAPEGCDDWMFIQQMRDAGAVSYLDCVGIHFNQGATSPSATSGHPADPGDHHYTWYYSSMTNLYYGTFGVPLCFTELGYLSSEGYGALSSRFWWAQSTTVAQQAAWLAETASIASQSGKVRLLIVYNVDFTNWGEDPQAGYAIIRPNGTCPACEALHNAWN